MKKHILVGIDTGLSQGTQDALCAVSELLEQAAPQLAIVLLNVVPLTQALAPNPGLYSGQIISVEVTPTQRKEAEDTIQRASLFLQQKGVPSERIKGLVRVGIPADEIVKIANELQVNMIVVGNRGMSLKQRLRRLLLGSTSQRVLQLASCPVMIVASRHASISQQKHTFRPPGDLVVWYEEAITRYISEHPGSLQVFTPPQVAQQFVPPQHTAGGRKELAAATLALEELARNGILCRHDVKGELRYVND